MCRLLWSKRSFPQQLLIKGGLVHTAPVPHPEGFTHQVYLLPTIVVHGQQRRAVTRIPM